MRLPPQSAVDGENGRLRQWSAVHRAASKAKLLGGSKERDELAKALAKLQKQVVSMEAARQDQLRQFAPYRAAAARAARAIDKQRKLLVDELHRATEMHNPAYKDDAVQRVKEGMAPPLAKLAMMLELQISLVRKFLRDFNKRAPAVEKLEDSVRSAIAAVFNEAVLDRQVQEEDERRMRAAKEGQQIEAELAAVGLSDRERREQEEHEQVLTAAVAANTAQIDGETADDVAELKRQCAANGLTDEDTAATIEELHAEKERLKRAGEEQATLAKEKLNVRLANEKRKQRAGELKEIELAKKEAALLAQQHAEEEALLQKQRDAARAQAEDLEAAAKAAAAAAAQLKDGAGGWASKLEGLAAGIESQLSAADAEATASAAAARLAVQKRMATRRRTLRAKQAEKKQATAAELSTISADGEIDDASSAALARAHDEELIVLEDALELELGLEESIAMGNALGASDVVAEAQAQLDALRTADEKAQKQAAYELQRRRARMSELRSRHARESQDLRAKHSEEAAPVQAELAAIHEARGGGEGADWQADDLLAAQHEAEVQVLAQDAGLAAKQEEASRAEAEARRAKEAAAAAEAALAEEARRTEEDLANQVRCPFLLFVRLFFCFLTSSLRPIAGQGGGRSEARAEEAAARGAGRRP
jgi:hypothetical protein